MHNGQSAVTFVPADGDRTNSFVGDRADKPGLLGYSEPMPLYFFTFSLRRS
jgi:hypothetical protein